MACACLGCINKRNYYLWLKDTVEEFGTKVPRSLQFDPWTASNSKLDSAINRMLKLYKLAFVSHYGMQGQLALSSETPVDKAALPKWELQPWDWASMKKKLSLS